MHVSTFFDLIKSYFSVRKIEVICIRKGGSGGSGIGGLIVCILVMYFIVSNPFQYSSKGHEKICPDQVITIYTKGGTYLET